MPIVQVPASTRSSRGVESNGIASTGVAPKVAKDRPARRVREGLFIALAAPLIVVLLVASTAVQPAKAAAPVIHDPFNSFMPDNNVSVSNDWAGYASSGSTYTSVAGSWMQPSVDCSTAPSSYSAYWVGLDGYASRTVEQVGTDSDCSQGSPTYYAWYEMYPSYPVNLSQPVAAGDAISASVTSDGSGSFTLTITDATQHWSYKTQKTSSSAQLGSAEWIAEAPSNGRRTLQLADFGTVTFTNATANGVALGSNPNLDEIELGSSFVGIEATPSTISASGTSFSVTSNVSSGSSPSPGSRGSGSTSPYPTSPYPTSPTSPNPGHHHHWGEWGGGWSQVFGGWGG